MYRTSDQQPWAPLVGIVWKFVRSYIVMHQETHITPRLTMTLNWTQMYRHVTILGVHLLLLELQALIIFFFYAFTRIEEISVQQVRHN